jgi:putative transposase
MQVGLFRYIPSGIGPPWDMSSPRLAIGRCSENGRIYSVTTVCRSRRPIFSDPGTVDIVCEEIRRLEEDRIVDSFAWVIMPDHLHWIFRLHVGPLARCMRCLKGRGARRIGLQIGKSGGVWQPGYFDHALRSDDSLRKHVRYLVENPVRIGLTSSIREYPHVWCVWDVENL